MRKWLLSLIFLTLSSSLFGVCEVQGDRLIGFLRQARAAAASDQGLSGDAAAIRQTADSFLNDPGSLSEAIACVTADGYRHRLSLMAELLLVLEEAGTDDQKLEFYNRVGLGRLMAGLGFAVGSRATGDELKKQISDLQDRWDAVGAELGEVTVARKTLVGQVKRFGVLLLGVQSLTIAKGLSYLFYTYWDVLPESFKTEGALIGAGAAVVGQAIAAVRWAWPRLRGPVATMIYKKRYGQLVESLADVLRNHPDIGIHFIAELAAPRPGISELSEMAALDALKKVNFPVTTAALVEIAMKYLEIGEINAGVDILEEIMVREKGTEVGALADDLKKATAVKADLEKKLRWLRYSFVFKRVVGTGFGLGAVTGALALYEPRIVTTLRLLLINLVGIVSARQWFLRVWFTCPDDALKQALIKERNLLTQVFTTLLGLDFVHTIPFIISIAKYDKHTHSIIRECAEDALKQSKDPRVAEAWDQLATHAIVSRADPDLIGRYLSLAISHRQDCAKRVGDAVWKQASTN